MTEAATDGQRQLCELEATLSEIAAAVGCGKSTASYWRRGVKLPSQAARGALAEAFGIPVAAWDAAPGARVEPESEHADDLDDEDEVEEREGLDTLSLVNAQIRSVLRQLRKRTLTEAGRAKKEDILAKHLGLRARLEREQELVEDRVVREHPRWRRIREVLLEALRPHPEAAKDVARAMEELEEPAA